MQNPLYGAEQPIRKPTQSSTVASFEQSIGKQPLYSPPSNLLGAPAGASDDAYSRLLNRTPSRTTWNAGDSKSPYLTLPSKSKLVGPPESGLGRIAGPPPARHKRASEDEDEDSSAHNNFQPKPKRNKISQSKYTSQEGALVTRYLKEEVAKGNLTETKWENVSERLKKDGVDKSRSSVKNWWSRYGREASGFDERQKLGRSLVTSKQNPEERKRAREQKKLEKQQVKVQGN